VGKRNWYWNERIWNDFTRWKSHQLLYNIAFCSCVTKVKLLLACLQNTVSNFGLVPNCNWIALLIYFTKLNNGKIAPEAYLDGQILLINP
jgi:hypothetical protein